MRFSACRIVLLVLSIIVLFFGTTGRTQAQSNTPSPTTPPTTSSYDQFRTPNVDTNVPRNSHTYTQVVLIDVLSAFMCQLTGIDPANPHQACLGVNPQTGKIGMAPSTQQFGEAKSQPQVGGALGLMGNLIGFVYTPTVSSSQYFMYLSSNFGIVKSALAAPPAQDCSKSPLGYGFCGLEPIFKMWTMVRDMCYALLTLMFVILGIGVMVRFKADPRTVMTLQNQIPRVIIAILLITFSYAIAGFMIDLMWTATYAGVTLITTNAPTAGNNKSTIAMDCHPDAGKPNDVRPLKDGVALDLLTNPLLFANDIFLRDCNGNISSGLVNVSSRVTDAIKRMAKDVIIGIMGWTTDIKCSLIPLHFGDCLIEGFLWITGLIISLIVIIAMLIALLRLWWELIKTYLTLIIFIILGPLWIVMGLIPGRPLGFEKWIRIIFANLAVFPLAAFILVFGRVMMDAFPADQPANAQSTFIPPLVGNPNLSAFGVLLGFGAIMLAPSIPGMIKERMKAKGSGDYGKTIAAGLGFAAGAATAPGKKAWESLNHVDQRTGTPEGALAVAKQKAIQKTPFIGRRYIAKKNALHKIYNEGGSGDLRDLGEVKRSAMTDVMTNDSRRLRNRLAGETRRNRAANNMPGVKGERRWRVGNLKRRADKRRQADADRDARRARENP